MAKQTFVLIFLLGVLGATTADDVARSCGDNSTFQNVDIFVGDVPCTTSPCQLVRGETARCLITYETVELVSQITQKVTAKVLGTGITTNYPVPNADQGCDKVTDNFCPINEGETATNELAFDVLKLYPLVDLELTIELLNEAGHSIACFVMNGKVSN